MKTKEKEAVYVGVDVSKDALDVYRSDTGEHIKIENTEVDINALCKKWKKKNAFVAMEATGGYNVKKSIREVLESLKKQLKSVDSQLAKMLESDTVNKRTIEILQSVKGIGPLGQSRFQRSSSSSWN